jgi:hypothetical protein
MYQKHDIFVEPEDKNVKIWRYMDIIKFLSILERKSLFFSRMDLLGDPFEGSIPKTKGQPKFNLLPKILTDDDNGTTYSVPKSFSIHDSFRKLSYVYSFHINSAESAALWSIYTKSKQGVAIQSTYKNLCESFNDYSENDVFIGLVNYIDYTTETIQLYDNVFPPLLHKRKSFEYEKELRAIIIAPKQFLSEGILVDEFVDKLPKGIYIPVNLDILIEKIYIAPTTQSWIKSLLLSLMEKYGLNKEIFQSDLDQNPIF